MPKPEKIRFDQHGPSDAFEQDLLPAARAALARGRDQYGEQWLRHLHYQRPLDDALHTIRVHADCRIAQALEHLDYDDIDGFIARLGSAVGYLANAICKARFYQAVDEEQSDG